MSSLLSFLLIALTALVYVEGLGFWPGYATVVSLGSKQDGEDTDRQQTATAYYYTFPPDSLPGFITGQVQQVVDYIYGEEDEEEEGSEEEPTTTPAPTTTTKKKKPVRGGKK